MNGRPGCADPPRDNHHQRYAGELKAPWAPAITWRSQNPAVATLERLRKLPSVVGCWNASRVGSRLASATRWRGRRRSSGLTRGRYPDPVPPSYGDLEDAFFYHTASWKPAPRSSSLEHGYTKDSQMTSTTPLMPSQLTTSPVRHRPAGCLGHLHQKLQIARRYLPNCWAAWWRSPSGRPFIMLWQTPSP